MTLPKFTLEGVIVSPACRPLPVTGITALDPWELVTVTFPLIVSAAFGLKARFMTVFFPAARTIGVEIPLAVTSFALTLT